MTSNGKNQKSKIDVRNKLFKATVLSNVIFALLITAVGSYFIWNTAQKAMEKSMLQIAETSANHISDMVNLYTGIIDEFADDEELISPNLTTDEKGEYLELNTQKIKETVKGNIDFRYIDLKGNIATTEYNAAERGYFKEALNGNRGMYMPIIRKDNNNVEYPISVPVLRDGSVVGVIAAYFDYEAFQGIMEKTIIGETGSPYIINKDRIIVFSINESQLLHSEPDNRDTSINSMVTKIENKGLKGDFSGGVYYYEGSFRITAAAPIEGTQDWIIFVPVDIFEVLENLPFTVVLLLIIAIIVGLAMVRIINKKIYSGALDKELERERVLRKCASTLSDDRDSEKTLTDIVHNIIDYYKASRICIYKINRETSSIVISNQIITENSKKLPNEPIYLPYEIIEGWSEILKSFKGKKVRVEDIPIEADFDTYKNLIPGSDDKFFLTPLVTGDNNVLGFVSVDEPKQNEEDAVFISNIANFIVNHIDKEEYITKLKFLGYHDILTNAFERNKYIKDLDDLEKRGNIDVGIVYIDINGLKLTNQTYGQKAGNEIIVRCANIIRSVFGNHLYRLGADEFLVIYPDITESEFTKLVQEFTVKISRVEDFTLSFGHCYKKGTNDVAGDIDYTSKIMFAEKQKYYKEGKGDSKSTSKLGLKNLLKDIKSGKFEIKLQPKVDLNEGKIIAAEALVRKRDDEGNLIAPYKFIPVYEKDKTIRHVDLFVLEEVCKCIKKWKEEGIEIAIATNISRYTLMERDIVNDVAKICDKYKVQYSQIEIEVTESNNDIKTYDLVEKVKEFRAKGFEVSLDDFGAEYSNFAILPSLEVSTVKLDKSIIDNLSKESSGLILAKNILNMCKELKVPFTLAEGIETKEQWDLLKELGCDEGQGYFFSKPVSVLEFYDLIKEQK